jgi:hypothetical protein
VTSPSVVAAEEADGSGGVVVGQAGLGHVGKGEFGGEVKNVR